MKVAILETVKAKAGFELEFDKIIIEALRKAGHEPVMMVPEKTELDRDFGVPVYELAGGAIVSYDRVHGLKKLIYSLKREYRRIKWFDSAAQTAVREGIDAILLTTATYRYLRSLQRSKLLKSSVPVYFIFLGVNPQEKPKFLRYARKCLGHEKIKLCVTTLRDDFGSEKLPNLRLIQPPVMMPEAFVSSEDTETLKIGFFGHYRKGEKKMEWLLDIAAHEQLPPGVRFIVQLAPTTAEDEAEARQIAEKYSGCERIEFIKRKLLQDDWYEMIRSVDVMYLPYTAERYIYNWSAIYFTAIGAGKPVLTTRVLNPEVMERFHIGEIVDMDDAGRFKEQMLDFIANFEARKSAYKGELAKANAEYAKEKFIGNLLGQTKSL